MQITLKSREELDGCRAKLRERGLDFSNKKALGFWRWPYQIRYRLALPLADPLKSWDVLHAIDEIERQFPDRSVPILDMGCFNSEVVYDLHKLGYREVHGCDLNPSCRWMPFWHQVKYKLADITKTGYPDRHFGVITCLSVVEHGVPLEPLANEVARLLKPGGLFLFTTDFDASGSPHDIDPKTRLFGQPWTIFTPETLGGLIDLFKARGFTLARPDEIDTSHVDRPIHWNDQDYTFTMIGLKAPN